MMLRFLGLISLFVAVSSAQAHPNHFHEIAGTLQTGFLHPLAGIDHLLAMVLVGLLATQMDGRPRWSLPALFCGSMGISMIAGHTLGPFATLDVALAITLIVLGTCLVRQNRFAGLVAIVATCGGLHGFSHAAGSAAGVSTQHMGGIFLGTVALHLVGMTLGIAFRQSGHRTTLVRVSGMLACGVGIALLVG
ncbi:HupE / UreJ protein [Stieleria maiorica]|uniref:HupE / UreJ protein n=1 Tax=Stieleria maiorica TaxID=2795974 RepID=A0A5B9MGM6_9BACT|nr:HupE/UreJ family protein [Stieleria maiorica]QEF99180.1 HupE / UreJ protein [Stieleria maiorica]